MAQLQSPETYVDGQQVTAARLNNQTNGATLLPGSITDQSALTANTIAVADTLLIHDASASALRKATASDLLNSGISLTTGAIIGNAGVDITITPAAGQKTQVNDNLTVTGNETINGGLTVTGNTICDAALTVNGIPTFATTAALKLPVGTTGQRPGTPVQGQIRYNTTTSNTEIYNGTTWEEVGGGPFDATGGNRIIAPDTTVVSASFTSVNGESVVVTSGGHSVSVGQIVHIVTAVAGYSGDYQVIAADSGAGTFTYIMPVVAVANSGSCTYNKAGNFKCHIFTTSGTFTAGTKGGNVEVLVVGGGGGGSSIGSFPYSGGGGGGGAVVYYPYYNLTPGQVVNITVGTGGAASTNGTASTFGTISAGGGGGASGITGGVSGTGTLGNPGNPGTTASWGPAGGSTISRNGGGGGAGGSPASYSSNNASGLGGPGKGSSIIGVPQIYGGGGSAQINQVEGRDGGGGFAQMASNGGGGQSAQAGANGIVIVRYPYWL
jgi:hypothetical protein